MKDARWARWDACSLCEQKYHGVVACALGWACWKTYLGRPEADQARNMAMTQLGNGLSEADHHEDALSVQEAELSMRRRLGAPEAKHACRAGQSCDHIIERSGRYEEALSLLREVYSGY